MSDELIIVEQDSVIIVAWADDPEDWIVRFDKHPDFPALQWAKRMVGLFNRGGNKTPTILKGIEENNIHFSD